LSVLAGFCYLVKNQLKAKGGIWSCGCWVCSLGFCKWAENWLYITCLTSLNQMVSWFCV
jgi:hypothetical protein